MVARSANEGGNDENPEATPIGYEKTRKTDIFATLPGGPLTLTPIKTVT